MYWQDVKRLEKEAVKIPGRWLHIHYYEALTLLFRIENALRVFVYVTLKRHFGDEWQNQSVTSDDSTTGTIGSLAKQRMKQAGTFGYLGFQATCPIMYLTGGELIRFLSSDPYWKYFNDAFAASREIVRNKLDEIGVIRNSLAHFRAIKKDDVEVIKHNAKQIMKKIEERLSDVIITSATVPTNTTDDWFQELRTLGNDLCTLTFKQSNCGQWIKVKLSYSCPVITEDRFASAIFYRLLSLNGPEILKIYNDLAKRVIYMTQMVPWVRVIIGRPAHFQKVLSMVFHIEKLKEDHSIITNVLGKILVQVEKETELIKQDNLAKGRLVELVNSNMQIPEGDKEGFPTRNQLLSPSDESDPPEWWGELKLYVTDFISGTHTYPWISTNIAEMQF